MSDTPETSQTNLCNAALQNAAVARCCEAYEHVRKQAMERRKGNSTAESLAEKAYKQALPALSGRDNIRDFIACVVHGMLMGVFLAGESTRLLYAAQVAQSGAERSSAKQTASV